MTSTMGMTLDSTDRVRKNQKMPKDMIRDWGLERQGLGTGDWGLGPTGDVPEPDS